MSKNELLYSGKAKELYETQDENILRVVYLDQATALNGLKKDQVLGKGELNNEITSLIFKYLLEKKIPNHFKERVSKTEQLVEKVSMIPLEVVLRNIATGSFVKKFNGVEGKKFSPPIIEFYYKNDALDDPMMNESHVYALELATPQQVLEIYEQTYKLNDVLVGLFEKVGITLVDFKVEFGIDSSGAILLADEISPDTCRLWDSETGKSLDKDVYRKDTGDLVSVYREVYRRLKQLA